MFKKVLTACASLIFTSGMALAGNFDGDYSDGQQVAVSIQSNGDRVQGRLTCRGVTLALAGHEVNGMLEGILQANDGDGVPFVAAFRDGGLVLRTQSANFTLARANGADNARPPVQQAARFNAQMARGNVFSFPLPSGWNFNESTNALFVCAPDGFTYFGFTGLEGVNTGNAMQFLHFMMERVHRLPLHQVVSTQPVQVQGGQCVEVIYLTDWGNGKVSKTWARTLVTGSGGYVLLLSTPADRFEQIVGTMQEMAQQVQIFNGSGAFQRDVRLAIQRNTNLNHPMDHSFADQYWKNQKRTEDVMRRDSDVRRDSYVSTDPQTGQQYYHTQDAYDPRRGGVPNPERPDEILTPAPHWQNR